MDVPEELSAEEQLRVDHPGANRGPVFPGARVFGQYEKAFYPATICSARELDRYTIHFIEDGIVKDVPMNGVFPLSKLVPGVITMISPSPDDLSPGSIGREVEVLAIPDSTNAAAWKEGKFKVRGTDTTEEITVVWTQFYFRKQDAEVFKLKETATPLESQSSRAVRSRAAFNRTAFEQPKTPDTATHSARERRNRKSRTTADVQPHESEASEAADAAQQSVDASTAMRRVARKSTAGIPAKRSKSAQALSRKAPQAIFQNRKFVLTRVNRSGQPQFNKREFRILIEQRGGTVIDDFKVHI